MRKIFFLAIILISVIQQVRTQNLFQTIRGTVLDNQTQMPLPGAAVFIKDTDPLIGTTSDNNGQFRLEKVPVGRHDVQVNYLGYETYVLREIMISSGKETVLKIELKESLKALDEVTVKANSDKESPINKMNSVSARQLSVEEAGRYAGGYDDFARLASSFAGVSSGLSNNGIVIRGNAPKGLLWRMEGVEISNPNHFANMATFGGGGMTSLSSHMLGNSDFITGAFPAEYGNALSGVFDLNIRTGNNEKSEHAAQIGGIGIDVASEGPFVKGKKSSYNFNYRYSTLALLSSILPPEAGKITYQDLSWKLNFPTKKVGTFSFWGIVGTDGQDRKANTDTLSTESEDSREEAKTFQLMEAVGLSHKYILGKNTWIHSTLASSGNLTEWNEKSLDSLLALQPKNNIYNDVFRSSFSSELNNKFGIRHSNRTGIILTNYSYTFRTKHAAETGAPMLTYNDEKGQSLLTQAYTQSSYDVNEYLSVKAGVHFLYFSLTGHYSVEPRIGLNWKINPIHTLSFAYGLHSQIEPLNIYLLEQNQNNNIVQPNTKLDFGKANHFVLSYNIQLNEFTHVKFEPFYQSLFNIPVVPLSYISLQNMESAWFFNDSLINKGAGLNAGVDLTLERFIKKGFYYLFTASVFESTYKGGDGVQRSSLYNKNYVVNALAGKEWQIGRNKRNIFSINGRITFQGGNRYIPVDVDKTFAQQEIVYDVAHAYEGQIKNSKILSFTINLRTNYKKFSTLLTFHMINALSEKEFEGYIFNKKTQQIIKKEDPFIIPNISYKIEF